MKRYTVTNVRFNLTTIRIPADLATMFEYAREYNDKVQTVGEVLDMYLRSTLVAYSLEQMKFTASESILNKPTMQHHTTEYINEMVNYDTDTYADIELTVEFPSQWSVVLEDIDEGIEVSSRIKHHMIDSMPMEFEYKIK